MSMMLCGFGWRKASLMNAPSVHNISCLKWLALEVLLMAMETMITIDPAWKIFAGIKFWLNDEKTVCYTVTHIFIRLPLCGSLYSWNNHDKVVVFGFTSSGHWGLNYFWPSSMQLPNNWSVHFASFFRSFDSIWSLISLYLASVFECVQTILFS